MPSLHKTSLRQMLAALDDDQRKRLAAAISGVTSAQSRHRLTRFSAWRLLTESRRTELAIARKLEGLRHA